MLRCYPYYSFELGALIGFEQRIEMNRLIWLKRREVLVLPSIKLNGPIQLPGLTGRRAIRTTYHTSTCSLLRCYQFLISCCYWLRLLVVFYVNSLCCNQLKHRVILPNCCQRRLLQRSSSSRCVELTTTGSSQTEAIQRNTHLTSDLSHLDHSYPSTSIS